MCESEREWVGGNNDHFGERVEELQIHYTYRGWRLKVESGRGWLGLRTGKHLEGQTMFVIQCMREGGRGIVHRILRN